MNDKNLNIIPIDDSEDSPDYVGIKANNGAIDISVPRFLKLDDIKNPSKDDRKLLLLFLRSINIAKTLNKDYFKKIKESGNFWPIESYLWIINDYLENGYYYNREKKYYNDNKGKIDWKKTIKNVPVISNGNVIYDKLVTLRTASLNSIITDIYKVCLKHSLDKMSWYRNLNIRVDVVQTKSVSEMEYIIKKELNNTFDDIKRLRFKHMLAVLSLADEQDLTTNNFTYWINNYHYVYECMISYLFKGVSENDRKEFDPFGSWIINGMKDESPASKLRPDTIVIKENNENEKEIFVLDAKMYKFGYTANVEDLMDSQSIQKQITYGDYIHNNDYLKNKYPNAKIRNAFIVPYNPDCFKGDLDFSLEKVNDNISYIGKAYGNWRKNGEEKQEYDNIYTFVIDFNYLLKNYMTADTSDIDKLCQKIDEYIANERM